MTKTNMTYYRRKALGVCPGCGNTPGSNGRTYCPVCLAAKRVKRAKVKARAQRRSAVTSRQPTSTRRTSTLSLILAAALSRRGAIGLALLYDRTSGSAEECWRHIEEQQMEASGCAMPEERAWAAASYRVARVNAQGVAINDAAQGDHVAATGDLTNFAAGDQRQRYVVTAFDPVLKERFVFGWASDPGKLVLAIMRHARFWSPQVRDRKAVETEK